MYLQQSTDFGLVLTDVRFRLLMLNTYFSPEKSASSSSVISMLLHSRSHCLITVLDFHFRVIVIIVFKIGTYGQPW